MLSSGCRTKYWGLTRFASNISDSEGNDIFVKASGSSRKRKALQHPSMSAMAFPPAATLSNLQALKKLGGAKKKARGPSEQSEQAEDPVTQEDEQEFDKREEEAAKKKAAAAVAASNMTTRKGRKK